MSRPTYGFTSFESRVAAHPKSAAPIVAKNISRILIVPVRSNLIIRASGILHGAPVSYVLCAPSSCAFRAPAARARRRRGKFAARRPPGQCDSTRYVLFAPTHKREQHLAQRAALRGKRVGVPNRALLVGSAGDDASTFQALEAIGKDVGRNALRRKREFPIGALAVEQVAHYKERPLVTHDVERVCDRTGGTRERLCGIHCS